MAHAQKSCKDLLSFCFLRKFLYLAAIALLISIPHNAQAQYTHGCDPDIVDAMQAASEAKVAVSAAVDLQLMGASAGGAGHDMDDSVLATTCFNLAASNSATNGAVFSAPFGDILAGGSGTPGIISDALGGMFANNTGAVGASLGSVSGAVNYASNIVTNASNALSQLQTCLGQIDTLWTEQMDNIQNSIVQIDAITGNLRPAIPNFTLDSLANGIPPGLVAAGSVLETSLNNSNAAGVNVFTNFGNVMATLDAARANPADVLQQAVPRFVDPMTQGQAGYTGAVTPCQVVQMLSNTAITCP